jgi:hypothetical protein
MRLACAFAQKVGPSGKLVARTLQVNVSNHDLNAAVMNESFCDFHQFLHAYEWVIGPPVFRFRPRSVPTDRLQLIILCHIYN